MYSLRPTVLVVALALPGLCLAQNQGAGVTPEGKKGQIYKVQKGDTLWGISQQYLGTPWIWPSVWKENEAEIANPHLIFPGELIWISEGMSCDGDTVSVTAASQPSLEDVVTGLIPGLPRVHLHNKVLAYETGEDFLQVFRKGEWRRLPTYRQRLLARYTLAMPFLQAFTGVLIPLSVVSIVVLDVPIVLALLSFVPLVVTAVTLAVEVVGLYDLRRLFGGPARRRDVVRLVAGAPLYQVMLAAAAVRAVWRELLGRNDWEKTAHTGSHLRPRMAEADAA